MLTWLRKLGCSGIFQNGSCSPPPDGSTKEFRPHVSCENLDELLEVKHSHNCLPFPPWLGALGLFSFHCPPCTSALGSHSSGFRTPALAPGTAGPCGCLLGKAFKLLLYSPALPVLGQQFAQAFLPLLGILDVVDFLSPFAFYYYDF